MQLINCDDLFLFLVPGSEHRNNSVRLLRPFNKDYLPANSPVPLVQPKQHLYYLLNSRKKGKHI